MAKFPTFDHESHAALYPPPPNAVKQWHSCICDRPSPGYWGKIVYMPRDEKQIVLAAVAYWIMTWLKTLPDDATVNARQLFDIFIPGHGDGTGKDTENRFKLWSTILSITRANGHLDGYWSRSEKKNLYGRNYINHHNKRASS